MIDVIYGADGPDCPWEPGRAQMRVRTIDVARAAALTVSAGAGRSRSRRLMHTVAVAMEVIAHLRNDSTGDGLHTVGLNALDATARAEVVQRIGVGLTRVVAERSALRLTDFYNLDALASDPDAPVDIVHRQPYSRRRPDFAGRAADDSWTLLEAKGRTGRGALRAERRHALEQIQAVDLQQHDGTPIEVRHRVSCVARLGTRPLAVFADDPPADEPATVFALDESQMLLDYYLLARELVVEGRGPRLSGAAEFVAVAIADGLVLGVHRALVPVLSDPERLLVRRAELQEELIFVQLAAEDAEDVDLSVGRDGLALASRTAETQDVLGGAG